MNEAEKEEYITYLKSRKSSHKTNWYLESLKEIKKIQSADSEKPKILVQACCGPCAGWPLEFLHQYFEVTVFYNNSNIWPESEYAHRLSEIKRLLKEEWHDEIKMIVTPYDNDAYTKKLAPRADDPEGWKRCFLCYELRMEQGYQYAVEHGYDFFTTVMTISRQKDSQKFNEIGLRLEKKYPTVKYFVSDFKKGGGQDRRNEIVHTYQLYDQDYCGCVYSYYARHPQKANE